MTPAGTTVTKTGMNFTFLQPREQSSKGTNDDPKFQIKQGAKS